MRSGRLLLAFVAALHLGTAQAEIASTNLQVSARVLPHARLLADESPVSITVADVQRGYLDVARRYRLQTNAPDQVVLQLNPRVGLADSIDIEGFQAPLRMTDSSLEIAQPFARDFTVRFRLWLNAAAIPGNYSLPVQVAVIIR